MPVTNRFFEFLFKSRRITTVGQSTLSIILSLLLIFQPAVLSVAQAQEIVIDPNGNVGSAPVLKPRAGPKVVDIAKPNASGVSLNQYTTFNVTAAGVVLNNAQAGTTTQLTGAIDGNLNLTAGSASTIVNEVTSGSGTSMLGAVEVAGSRANVVIANPNGILCSGCNFINAGTATLTTGVPMISGGVVRLDITKGAVTIGRGGLNGKATSLANVNLLGRTVTIDGAVSATGQINVQSGPQGYDLALGKSTLVLPGNGAAGTSFAIDATAFGAMEAGRIQIIGNEQGVGVRTLGALKSTTLGVSVTGMGDTTVASISAKTDARVANAYGNLTLDRDISALTGVVVATSTANITAGDRAGIFGFAGVTIGSTKGAVALTADIQSNGDIVLNGPLLTFGSYLSTTGNVAIYAKTSAVLDGATIVANRLSTTAPGNSLSMANTAIFTAQDVQIGAVSFSLGRDVIVDSLVAGAATKLVVLASGDFRNGADLRLHKDDLITYAGNFYNEATGIMQASALNISFARDVYNSGILLGDNTLTLNVRGFFNSKSGSVLSDVVSITTTGLLVNEGAIVANGTLGLSAVTSLTNKGFLQGTNIALIAPTVLNQGLADIRASGTLTVSASTLFDNTGSSNTIGLTTIAAGRFANAGAIIAEAGLRATAATIENKGTITTKTLLELIGATSVINSGTLSSFGTINLASAGFVQNNAAVLANGVLTVSGPRFSNLGATALVRAKTGSLTTAAIINSGEIYLISAFRRAGDIDLFQNDGVFASTGAVELSGRDALSRASFGAGSSLLAGLRADDVTQALIAGTSISVSFKTLTFVATKDVTTQKDVIAQFAAGGSISVSGPDALVINARLQAKTALVSLAGASITLGAAAIIDAATIRLAATSGVANNGVILASGTLSLAEHLAGSGITNFTNAKLIEVGQISGFNLKGIFTNSGVLNATGIVYAIADKIINSGHIQSDLAANLYGTTSISQSGVLSAGGRVILNSAATELTSTSYLAAAGLTVMGGSFNSAGRMSLNATTGDNIYQLTGAFAQGGRTFASSAIVVTAASMTSGVNSLLGSSKDVTVNVVGAASLAGAITAANVSLTAASIAGAATSDIFANTNIQITTTGVALHAGEIAAGAALTVNSGAFDLGGNNFANTINLKAITASVNRGNIFAQDSLTAILGVGFANYGRLEAKNKLTLTADSTRNYTPGEISASTLDLTFIGNFRNDNLVFGAKAINLKAGSVSNMSGSKIETVAFAGDTATTFANGGVIDVYGFAGIFKGAFNNTGTITAKSYLGLEATAVNNNGGIIVTGNAPGATTTAATASVAHAYFKIAGAFTNAATATVSAEQVDVRAASFSNAGLLTAKNVINVGDMSGAIANSATGQIYSKSIGLMAATTFVNEGIIGTTVGTLRPLATLVHISAGTTLANIGKIDGTNVRLVGQGSVTLTDTSRITATTLVGIKSVTGNIVNYGNITATDIATEAALLFDNRGLLRASDTYSTIAGSFINQSGSLRADGTARVADTRAVNIVLDIGGAITNSGVLIASADFGLDSAAGGVTNTGTMAGNNLQISALTGIADLGTLTRGTASVVVDARSVIIRGSLAATETVSLRSHIYDVDVAGIITTKKLLIDAKRNLIANAAALRGTDLTQIVANDILRKDSPTILNGKLAVISGATKDIYVLLRTGSIGVTGKDTLDITGYDTANFDVTGSISLLTTVGSINLTGKVLADNDIHVKSGDNTWLRNLTITAGDVLHLEAKDYLKNYGVTFDAGNKVELVQNAGWFYSTDWLGASVDFNLAVIANKIVVNADHRFVNKSVWFYARNDLVQRDHVVSARGVTYTAGGNMTIEFNPYDWRAANPGAVATGDYWNIADAGLRGSTLIAQSAGMTLYSGGNMVLQSGKIYSYGDLTMVASGGFISEPIYLETNKNNRPGNLGWVFSNKYVGVVAGHDGNFVTIEEMRAYENQIAAKGNITILAGGSAEFIGTKLTSADGSISVKSVSGRVAMVAAPGYWAYDYSKSTRSGWLIRKTTTVRYSAYEDIYKRTELVANNGNISLASTAAASALVDGETVVLTSTGTEVFDAIAVAGTYFSANNLTIETLASNRNILIGTYAERSELDATTTTRKSLFGFIPVGGSTSTTSVRNVVNSGSELYADEILRISSAKDLTIIGGSLTGRRILISAVGSLTILAAIDSTRATYFTEKTNLFTITTIQQGVDRETAALPTFNSGSVTFTIGGDVLIGGYRGATLNSQLLTVVGTKRFETSLLGLLSPTETTSATTAGQAVIDEYARDYVLPTAAQGSQFAYLDTLIKGGATYQTISLRDHTWYDKQVRLTPAFQALLSAVAAYVTAGAGAALGINNAVIAAGVDAATANLVAGIVGGAITGDIDLDQIMRGALLAGVSTSLTTLVTSKINLGNALGASNTSPFLNDAKGNFSANAILDRLGDKVVSTGLSNVVYGRDFFDNFDELGRTFLVTETMGVVQFGIGELGNGQGTWEGSLPHMLLHGGIGCVAMEVMDGNCASGFFAAVSQAVLSGSSLSDEQKLKLASLVGSAGAFLFADGQAVNVSFGGTISQSGLENNYLTHTQWQSLLSRLASCNGDPTCERRIFASYQALSEQQNQRYFACILANDTACLQRVRDDLAAVQFNLPSLVSQWANLNGSLGSGSDGAEVWALIMNLDLVAFDANEIVYGDGNWITREQAQELWQFDKATICGASMSTGDCLAAVMTVRRDRGQAAFQLLLELLPIIGDGIGLSECLKNPGILTCGSALVGIVPLAGDGARLFIKHGDDIIEVAVDGDKVVEAIRIEDASAIPVGDISQFIIQQGTDFYIHGIKINSKLPPPIAGYDYLALYPSHVTGQIGEIELANWVADIQGAIVLHWGDAIGTHGSDVISVSASGKVTLWDAKKYAGTGSLNSSSTFAPGSSALANAIAQAEAVIRASTLPNSVRDIAIGNISAGNFTAVTAAVGNSANSVIVNFANRLPL